MKNNSIEFLLNEYKEKFTLYSDFSLLIKNIITQLVLSQKLRFQMITSRPKDFSKLKEKINRKNKYAKLSEIEDLAGVRIVFYLESEKFEFVNILYQQFSECIVDMEYKYELGGYQASHFIFKLNKKRANLAEYRKFKNLKCELQVQSSLYHAWSEISHDIIYKTDNNRNGLEELGLKELEQDFQKLMGNIQELSVRLEDLNRKNKIMVVADRVFNNFLQDIQEAKTNDEIFEKMDILKDFSDKKVDVIFALIQIVLKKKPFDPVVIFEFEGKETYGKTHPDLIAKCIELLRRIYYFNPDEFLYLIAILINHVDKKIKKSSVKILEEFCEYRIEILERFGYAIQKKVLEFIKNWNFNQKLENIEFIATAAKNILCSSVMGVKETWNTTLIHHGAIQPNEELKVIRKDMIDLIGHLYEFSKSTNQKLALFHSLRNVIHTPIRGGYDESLTKMLAEDTLHVINTYEKMLFNNKAEMTAPIQVASEAEDTLYWIEKHGFYSLEASKIRKNLMDDRIFSIFFLLINDHRIYRDENLSLDLNYVIQKRQERINLTIEKIQENNIKQWISDLNVLAAENQLIDNGWYHHLKCDFLKVLSIKSPIIAERIFQDSLNEKSSLLKFSDGFMMGFKIGGQTALWNKFFRIIVSKKNPSLALAIPFSFFQLNYSELQPADLDLLNRLIMQTEEFSFLSQAEPNEQLHILIILSLINLYLANPKKIEKLIIKEIQKNPIFSDIYLKKLTYADGRKIDFSNWEERNVSSLSSFLIEVSDLDWELQNLLLSLSKSRQKPSLALDVFFDRLKKSEKNDISYTSIPFEINNNLKDFIVTSSETIVILQNWFNKIKEQEFSYHFHLLSFIEKLNISYKDILNPLLIKNDEENLSKILSLINFFYKNFDLEFCMEIVKKTKNQQILSVLKAWISTVGLVTGEYGEANAYENRVIELRKFEKDENNQVRKFVKKLIKDLENKTKHSKQKSDNDKIYGKIKYKEL